MLPGQMSMWQSEFVQEGPRNLSLKFGQNCVSNSWDIADIEFVVVLLRVGGLSENGNKAISASTQLNFNLN